MHLKKFQICPICNKRSISGATHGRCRKKLGLDGLTSVFVYRGLVRKLIGKLKYGLVTDLENDLLELMASFGDFGVISNKEWLLVGVPMHTSRIRRRGFNQAELLGESMARYFGWQYNPGVLVRNRRTDAQMGLKKEDRLSNVRGAFSVSGTMKSQITGKKVLLVDDVWTTGATLRECGKVLMRAGAGGVWGMTFAA